MELAMHKIMVLGSLAVIAASTPALASHPGNLDVAHPTRGACEAASAKLAVDDKNFLTGTFPERFSSTGEAASFLTRAFRCEKKDDGNWYITDYRLEVLASEWFLRRL
jgi:hypothetical protein